MTTMCGLNWKVCHIRSPIDNAMTRNENNTKCETARWFTRLKNWIVGSNCEPKLMFFVCLCPKFNKTLLTVIEIKLSRGLLSVSSIWNFKINEDVDSCKNHARTHGLKKQKRFSMPLCKPESPVCLQLAYCFYQVHCVETYWRLKHNFPWRK